METTITQDEACDKDVALCDLIPGDLDAAMDWWNDAPFSERQRKSLADLMNGPRWRQVLNRPELITRVRENALTPPSQRRPENAIVSQLVAFNEERVKERIRDGEREEASLLDELSAWPNPWPSERPPELSFLGLSITSHCNSQPRCGYCNKRFVEALMQLSDWKRVVDEVAPDEGDEGPYLYITGGEPVLAGEELYGKDGLIRYAASRGLPVNLNTNATLITPVIALALIESGLAKVHVSLDTHDEVVQDELTPGARFRDVLKGLSNLQLAREVIGVTHPLIHINSVLTRKNLRSLPNLLRFLFDRKKLRTENLAGPVQDNPLFRDLLLHVIPVGGDENIEIRPSAKEFEEFLAPVFESARSVWNEYQVELGVEEEKRSDLAGYGFYTPYHRVEMRGDLHDYARLAAEGVHSRLGLMSRCFVGPTQGFILPDGSQYWCGAHAVAVCEEIGNVLANGIRENIMRNITRLSNLPTDECCSNCPAAVLAINKNAHKMLLKKIEEWIAEASGQSSPGKS